MLKKLILYLKLILIETILRNYYDKLKNLY